MNNNIPPGTPSYNPNLTSVENEEKTPSSLGSAMVRPAAEPSSIVSSPQPLHRRHFLQAQLNAKATLLAQWDAWVAEGGSGGGQRTTAVTAMKTWLENADQGIELDLHGLELTNLPDLLPPARKIYISENKLTRFKIPAGTQNLAINENQLEILEGSFQDMEWLDASDNKLRNLPDMPQLEYLDISNNRNFNLNLSAELVEVYATHIDLSAWPESLPAALETLDLSGNNLTAIPEYVATFLTYSGEGCEIILVDNPIEEEVINERSQAMQASAYEGPRFEFSESTELVFEVRPIELVVIDWYEEGGASAMATWRNISHEDGASEFSGFLDRLQRSVNFCKPEFKKMSLSGYLSYPVILHYAGLHFCLA